MSENSGQQLLVKARFNFQQTNEDELTFTKGDIISVSRQEEGGWWEGTFNGRTGWFPSNYVREVKGSGGYNTIMLSSCYAFSVVIIPSGLLLAKVFYSFFMSDSACLRFPAFFKTADDDTRKDHPQS